MIYSFLFIAVRFCDIFENIIEFGFCHLKTTFGRIHYKIIIFFQWLYYFSLETEPSIIIFYFAQTKYFLENLPIFDVGDSISRYERPRHLSAVGEPKEGLRFFVRR